MLDSEKSGKLPLWLSVSKDTVELDTTSLKGDELEILAHSNGSELDKPVRMTITSSISHSGRLWNLTGDFSENEFNFAKGSYNATHAINLALQPSKELEPGNYTLTIGARYDSVTYNKIVNLQVK
jgi:hypothetical protein